MAKSDNPQSTRGKINPFIIFYPRSKDQAELDRQGDGPEPTPAAETLKPKRGKMTINEVSKKTLKSYLKKSKETPDDKSPRQFRNRVKGAILAKNKIKAKKNLKEESTADKVYKYLHKRRMYWHYRIDESVSANDFAPMFEEFIQYAASYLNLNSVPRITLKDKLDKGSFAVWTNEGIEVSVTNRHPMDVFRSVAHELVHQKQHEEDVLHAESGVTGSEHENEANAIAGIMMRNYAKQNPELFNLEHISEGLLGAVFGAPPKNKKGKKRGPDFDKQMARDKARHEYRMREIAARNAVKSKPKSKAEPEDDLADLRAHFHDPKRLPAIQSFNARQKRNANIDKVAWHKKFVASQGKTRKLAPGEKPFSDILKLKESIALMNKSIKSNVEYGVLVEVFKRGVDSWTEESGLEVTQYAFNRVDSFIAKGKAYTLDRDLI